MNAAQRPHEIERRTLAAAGFRLGEWIVRPADGSLASTGRASRLEPLLMELLVFLCSRPRQVISKDELLAYVWSGRFVSDDTVKAAFYQLRKALGDSARKPRFIETLPKRGYRVLLAPVPLDPEPRDPETAADSLVQRGKALLAGRPDPATLTQARLYLDRAIEADPDHADALAALAMLSVHLVALGTGGDLMARARALAVRSVVAAPGSAAGHAALGVTTLLHDRDVASAEEELRVAIALEPRDATAHRWSSKLLSFSGRHDEAIAEAKRAMEADPLSIASHRDLVEALFLARRGDEAIREAHELLRRFPQETEVQLGLAWLHWIAGHEQQAFEAFYAGLTGSGVARDVLDGSARVFREGGMPEVFRNWSQVLEGQAALGHKALDLVVLYALLGENDRAFEWIDRLVDLSHPAILWIPVSPVFDRLRSDVRYPGVLARLRRPAPDR